MEVLLPYLLLMGCGALGAILLCLLWNSISMGIVGNALTGMAGGFCCSYLTKYLFLFVHPGPISYAITGLLAGVVAMIFIGLLRRQLTQQTNLN